MGVGAEDAHADEGVPGTGAGRSALGVARSAAGTEDRRDRGRRRRQHHPAETAVAPVVEVRDRNDQPVAGALVSFTINGGRNARFAGGLRSVTLSTNAAGRAAATTATPTGSGAVQMNVAATFQGQTATATITQSNVATAAQASAASNASGGSASGGGLSTGTLTAIGAAAAGGLIATRRLTGATNQAPYLCGSSVSAGAGLAGATVYMITVEGCDDDGAVVTYRWDLGTARS